MALLRNFAAVVVAIVALPFMFLWVVIIATIMLAGVILEGKIR